MGEAQRNPWKTFSNITHCPEGAEETITRQRIPTIERPTSSQPQRGALATAWGIAPGNRAIIFFQALKGRPNPRKETHRISPHFARPTLATRPIVIPPSTPMTKTGTPPRFHVILE